MPLGYGSWSKKTEKKENTSNQIKHKHRQPKGRSAKTYQNKINSIKRKYRKLFNYSKKHKGNFHNRYSTVEDYLKLFKLKQPNTDK